MVEFSRRLEAVFGARLDALGLPHVEALVTNAVSEDFDLDFKAGLYGNNNEARRDLAGDIAALANTDGGVIVLGVPENAQGRAAATSPVVLSDAEESRMRLIIAGNVAPVPTFQIVQIPATGGNGFYLLVVPRSASAPHGVLVNQGFRYPVRNGSTTRYLSEGEVASAYRERFRGASRQVERCETVISQARLALADEPSWLIMCLVPEQAGAMDITRHGYLEFQQWTSAVPRLGVNDALHGHRVAANRYLADAGGPGPRANFVWLEAHTDGTGLYAVQLTDNEGSLDATGRVSTLLDQTLAASLMSGLRILGLHAQENAHTAGPALLRVELIPSFQANELVLPAAVGGGYNPQTHPTPRSALQPVETSVSIEDLLRTDRTLVEIAAEILHRIGQQFGFPELSMMQRDGQLNRVDWGQTWQTLLQDWADRADVELLWVR